MGDAIHIWPYYCEENVWHACDRPVREGREAYALFVSNESGRVAMWGQRQAPEGRALVWDYHVVLLERTEDGFHVHDPECREGPWLSARAWLHLSFAPLAPAFRDFAPRFRLVPADRFRQTFCSDRSHMRRGEGWRQPPPPWPPIVPEGARGSNLMRFVRPGDDFLGEVLDLPQLRVRVTGSARG